LFFEISTPPTSPIKAINATPTYTSDYHLLLVSLVSLLVENFLV